NYPEYANNVIQETIDYILESDNSENNSRRKVINIGISPLFRYSDDIQTRIILVFKYLMKAKFDDEINAIIETYDVYSEEIGNFGGKIDTGIKRLYYYFKKWRGLFITVIVLSSTFAISIPLISERKDHILDIFMFSFETVIQDRRSFFPGEVEGKLYQEINALEVNIQNKYLTIKK
ncbi:hypothetical protein PIROE2DRAFT_13056, partial [Piromyces sp. E2]